MILTKLLRGLFPRTAEAFELAGFRRAWSAAGRRGISFTCCMFAPDIANVAARLDELEAQTASPVDLKDLRTAVEDLEYTLAEGISFTNNQPTSVEVNQMTSTQPGLFGPSHPVKPD